MSAVRRSILVTGATGQVGWELMRALAPIGEVIGVSTSTQPLAMDLSKPDQIRAVVRQINPALIVNAGAYTAVDKAEGEPDLAAAINAVAPGVLAEEAKRLAVPLVHYSTDYVFDGAKAQPYTEEDAPNPINVYGRTKLAGEHAIQSVGGMFIILRASWIYGSRGKNFLLTMLRFAREKGELRVVADQVGRPTWARMVAEATAQVLGRFFSPTGIATWPQGLFHLGGTGSASWHGFAEAIVQRAHVLLGTRQVPVHPIKTQDYVTAAARPAYAVLAYERAARELGLQLPAWQDALEQCLADVAALYPLCVSLETRGTDVRHSV